MRIDILTIFPQMFTGPFDHSIVKRAIDQQIVEINIHDLRRWAVDKHRSVDDRPYGGGPGMVMMIEPVDRALKDIKKPDSQVILTSAKGDRFNQSKAQELSQKKHIILIAGHYEGVDQRVADHLINQEISIGNYVLTGGELPSMIITDAIVRLIPGVVGDTQSLEEESHNPTGYIEYPHYTRPEVYKGWKVPEVLTSGNHLQIKQWRQKNSQLKRNTT